MSSSPTLDERNIKLAKMRQLLDQHNVDGLLLRRISSFAWATCGAASYVNTAAAEGAATLLVTRQQTLLFTNNIEAPRLEQEEYLPAQGWEMYVSPWGSPQAALQAQVKGMRLAADAPYPGALDLSGEVARQRAALTLPEAERARDLGQRCAEAMHAAAHAIQPGMSEQHIAALLGAETQQRGAQPIVNLIATDERTFRHRHPLPTDKKLEHYAMLVLCGRRKGLVVSISRLVHFGPPPADLQRRAAAVAAVYAALNGGTRPGTSLAEIFRLGQAAYAAQGFPNEWQNHHQGGAAGYEPREYLGTPDSPHTATAQQIFAWNPSVAGAKAEDTILVGESANEVLTPTPAWPRLSAGDMDCPGILVL